MTDPMTSVAGRPTVAATTDPTTSVTSTSPAVGQGVQLTDLHGGWQVWPGEVVEFATAVQQVRDDLNAVLQQVDQLTSASYQAQLGTSPVGTGLTAKFVNRLSGGEGLLANLGTVLQHLDDFVSNAGRSAAHYQEADQASAAGLKSI
jgi:hypothetical protein